MGKTRRYKPKDGDFKMLKASKRQRNKKQRAQAKTANLQRNMQFAVKHRVKLNMAQLNASLYMEEDVHRCDHTKEYCDEHKDGVGCNMVAGQASE